MVTTNIIKIRHIRCQLEAKKRLEGKTVGEEHKKYKWKEIKQKTLKSTSNHAKCKLSCELKKFYGLIFFKKKPRSLL